MAAKAKPSSRLPGTGGIAGTPRGAAFTMGFSSAKSSKSDKKKMDELAAKGVSVGVKFKKKQIVILKGTDKYSYRVAEIKYIGNPGPKVGKGKWYGCELLGSYADKKIEPKNSTLDGAIKKKRFFKCPPKRGVFVKRKDIIEHCVDKGGRTATIVWYTTNYGRDLTAFGDIDNSGRQMGKEEKVDPNAEMKRLAWEALHKAMSKKSMLDTRINQLRATLKNYMEIMNGSRKKIAELQAKLDGMDGEIAKLMANIKRLEEYYQAEKQKCETAKEGVSTITKDQLVEIRSYKDPPDMVYTVLISVLMLRGTPETDWGRIARVLSERNFLQSITDFDSKKVTKKRYGIVDEMWRKANVSYEVVNTASKACGLLFGWVEAELSFTSLLITMPQWQKEIKEYRKQIQKIKDNKVKWQKQIERCQSDIKNMQELYNQAEKDLKKCESELRTAGFRVQAG